MRRVNSRMCLGYLRAKRYLLCKELDDSRDISRNYWAHSLGSKGATGGDDEEELIFYVCAGPSQSPLKS